MMLIDQVEIGTNSLEFARIGHPETAPIDNKRFLSGKREFIGMVAGFTEITWGKE